MPDPNIITGEQLRAAYDALGLDPERWTDTYKVHLGAQGVVIERIAPTTRQPETTVLDVVEAARQLTAEDLELGAITDDWVALYDKLAAAVDALDASRPHPDTTGAGT